MKNLKAKYSILCLSFVALPLIGYSQSLTINGGAGAEGMDSIPNGSAGEIPEKMVIKIRMSCFGTNLRSVSNPISPDSEITGVIKIQAGAEIIPLYIKFPGAIVNPTGGVKGGDPTPVSPEYFPSSAADPRGTSYSSVNNPSGAKAMLYGNVIQISMKKPKSLTTATNGSARIHDYYFHQKVLNCGDQKALWGGVGHSSYTPTYACGSYAGVNGSLSTSVGSVDATGDLSNINAHFAFPGQTGFCGGYFSPLMVFFDEQRPLFTAISDFPIQKIGNTYWPEENSHGYFLALDRNKNQNIDQASELFGDNNLDQPNGFEELKKLDSNKDGLIDKNDKMYSKLVLWNDKNSDGKSTKNELVALHKKVDKISLKYTKGDVTQLGKNAQAREHSKIWLIGEKSWSNKAKIEDIWISPAPTKLGVSQ